MQYISISDRSKLMELAEELEAQSFCTEKYEFLLSDDIVIYGYFKEESSEYEAGNLFVFGKTIRPDEITPSTSKSIFARLKQYGSSGKYKGLLNSKGDIILPNIYEEITQFAYDRLLVKKSGKYGIVDTNGKVLAEPKYDQIVDVWEYTIGFALNNKVGFMNTNCNIIIESKYCIDSIDNTFHNGLIVVSEIIDGFRYQYYIDHYGLIHGKMENISPDEEYYPQYENLINDEYSDPLDAYDGDPDARWNTD